MKLSPAEKQAMKDFIVASLKDEPEVRRIVVFGSFVTRDDPNDIDIAVFQDSDEKYLPLAIKYRERLYDLNTRIALDVFPIRPNPPASFFLREIDQGETIYERRPH